MEFIEQIKQFAFFDKQEINHIQDPLTGVLRREYIVSLIKDLIDKQIAFSMMMLDIDNFKLINDSEGHLIGDKVLTKMARELIDSIGKNGIVGRYGGDEFIIISTKYYEYDDVWKFTKSIYNEVFRHKISHTKLFEFPLTCTAGLASFPKDATDYSTLFLKVDKALYRGKQKGRNCFIIYIEEKHKNIDASLNKNLIPISETMNNIYDMFFHTDSFEQNLKLVLMYVCNFYSLSDVYLTKEDKVLYNYNRTGSTPPLLESFIEPILRDRKVRVVNDFSSLMNYKDIHYHCFQYKIKSFVCIRMYVENNNIGTFILQDTNIKRIWQNNEIAVFNYLVKLLGLMLSNKA